MKLSTIRWAAILGKIAGGAGTAIFALGGPRWVAIGGAVAAGAGLILDTLPATKLIDDAPILNQSGTQIATNVTTTSTLPIQAPTKAQGG